MHSSKLMQALEYYWNHTWAFEGRIKLIICGSSSSWILKNIIHNTGGLYNRVTKRLGLEPFNLLETKRFLASRGTKLSHDRIAELYMIMGGVPFYLSQVEKGQSIVQIINNMFFTKKSSLYNEYNLLLSALFDDSEDYDLILRTIAKHKYGIIQAELFKKGLSKGSRAIEKLKELEDVGFIQSYIPMGHQEKGKFYKMIDEYILFYFYWIEPYLGQIGKIKNIWQNRTLTPAWRVWIGISFESLCSKHIEKIAKALGVENNSATFSWRYVPVKASVEEGAQIDLLFDRSDNAITVCEIKYTDEPFVIDKQYFEKLNRKIRVFKKQTGTNKEIFLAIISAHGLKKNFYSEELVVSVVELDDLFKDN